MTNEIVWNLAVSQIALERSHVHVWKFNLLLSAHRIAQLRGILSGQERTQADQFRFPRDSHRFIVARSTVRMVLAAYLKADPSALVFTFGPYGKPYLASGDLCFNQSHSDELGVVAVANGTKVGVDIERLRPMDDALALAEQFLSIPERQELRRIPDPSGMLRGFLSAGHGRRLLSKPPATGSPGPWMPLLSPSFQRQLTLQGTEEDLAHWKLYDLQPAPGYAGALCVARGNASQAEPSISYWQWPERPG